MALAHENGLPFGVPRRVGLSTFLTTLAIKAGFPTLPEAFVVIGRLPRCFTLAFAWLLPRCFSTETSERTLSPLIARALSVPLWGPYHIAWHPLRDPATLLRRSPKLGSTAVAKARFHWVALAE